jgi:hypothetical protein
MNSEVAQAAAFCALGSTCLWRGEFGLARQHLEQAIAIYDRDIPRYLPMSQALVVPSRAQMSWALWMTGYSDQAQKRAAEALDLATRLGNPFSMAFTLMYTMLLATFLATILTSGCVPNRWSRSPVRRAFLTGPRWLRWSSDECSSAKPISMSG